MISCGVVLLNGRVTRDVYDDTPVVARVLGVI